MTFEDLFSEIRASGLKRSEINITDEEMQQLKQAFYGIGIEKLSRKNEKFDPTRVSTHINELISWTLGIANERYALHKGFLYKGPTGTGKTLLMRMYADFLSVLEYSYVLNRRSYPLQLQIVSTRHIAGMYSVKGYNLVEDLCDPDLYPMLCIDDIGAENQFQNNYGNKLSVINEIIERRHASSIPTFGTTNLNNFKDTQGYDDRIVRRIKELFNIRVVNPSQTQKQTN